MHSSCRVLGVPFLSLPGKALPFSSSRPSGAVNVFKSRCTNLRASQGCRAGGGSYSQLALCCPGRACSLIHGHLRACRIKLHPGQRVSKSERKANSGELFPPRDCRGARDKGCAFLSRGRPLPSVCPEPVGPARAWRWERAWR